jgi:hypothetical protein
LSAAALDSLLRFSSREMDLFHTVGSALASSCLQLRAAAATFAISNEQRVGKKVEKFAPCLSCANFDIRVASLEILISDLTTHINFKSAWIKLMSLLRYEIKKSVL